MTLTADLKLEMSLDDISKKSAVSSEGHSETTPGKLSNPRLYVGNLSYDTSWQDLKDHMRQAGNVIRADIMMFPGSTRRSKGCGLVEYETIEDAQKAIEDLNNTMLNNRQIFVREDRVEKVGQIRSRSPQGSSTSLYVGNLPYSYSWQDLKDLFRPYGEIVRADIIVDSNRRSRGFGTVQFAYREDADSAIDRLNGADIDGRSITVRFDTFC